MVEDPPSPEGLEDPDPAESPIPKRDLRIPISRRLPEEKIPVRMNPNWPPGISEHRGAGHTDQRSRVLMELEPLMIVQFNRHDSRRIDLSE